MDSKVFYHWIEPDAAAHYRTGVSLHSHTNHSRESLDFIARMGRTIPMAWQAVEAKIQNCKKKTGVAVDLDRAFWTPPLTPRMAFAVEAGQIANDLQLTPMVSLTDHDTIAAPLLLRTVNAEADTPISVEWSAEFREVMFHIGVHNLPAEQAQRTMADLAAYTSAPQEGRLRELLESLQANPEVLIVLNHPLWDLYENGAALHRSATLSLLNENGQFIHALELNGLRSWEENRAVRELAEGWNLPVIAGGDRHGCEPNANVNLSNAATFAEFTAEVRRDRHSHVLMMPQYTEPMQLRVLQTVLDVIRDYPQRAPDSQSWDGRVFHPQPDGTYLPLSAMWRNGRPRFFQRIFWALRLAENGPMRQALRLALHDERNVRMALELAPGQE